MFVAPIMCVDSGNGGYVMKKKTLCILSGLLFLIIFSFPLQAEPLPYLPTPPPPPRILIPTPPPPATPPPATLTCDGASIINLNMLFLPSSTMQKEAIQTALDTYMGREVDGVYKLCFNIQNGPALLTSGLSFNHASTKPVLISGLQMRRDSSINFDLFAINTTSRVTLINSDIQGVGAEDAGTCVVLRGSGHTIKSSRIFDCDKGVLFEGSNNFLGAASEATFDTEKNEIFNNKTTGILWNHGIGNRFPFNSIYYNGNILLSDEPILLPDDAIQINPALGIPRPELIVFSEDTKNVLRCEKDPSTGEFTNRWINLRSIIEGEVLLYETFDTNIKQPDNFITKCVPDSTGKCILPSSSRFTWPTSMCGTNVPVVALVDNPNFTTRVSNDGKLFGAIETMISGGVTPVDITSPGGDMARSAEEETIEGGEHMAGAAAAVEGGGANLVSSAPSAGSCGGGGGATIVPPTNYKTVSSGLIHWWLIFTAPAVLLAVRIKKRK